jgi:5-oxoprolinase (ATP-hydrolysing) subunit A
MSPAPSRPILGSSVRLSMDVGELADEPDEFYSLAHLVHVACGGHAGDPVSMERAVRLAALAKTQLGVHPSYPDRENFGRRTMPLSPRALRDALEKQLSTFAEVARAAASELVSVKAHGALYHDLTRLEEVVQSFLDAVQNALGTDVAIVGPPQSLLADRASARGFEFWTEGFVDRNKAPDGTLLPRTDPNALILDPEICVREALLLAKSGQYQTLCLHGDTPAACELGRAVRRALDQLERSES